MNDKIQSTIHKDGKEKKSSSKQVFSGLKKRQETTIDNVVSKSELFWHLYQDLLGFILKPEPPDKKQTIEQLQIEVYLLRQFSHFIIRTSYDLRDLKQEMIDRGSQGGRPSQLTDRMLLWIKVLIESETNQPAKAKDVANMYNKLYKINPAHEFFKSNDIKKTTKLPRGVCLARVKSFLEKYKDIEIQE